MEMFDWRVTGDPQDEKVDRRPWSVDFKTTQDRIDITAICPDGTKREIWVEIDDGRLVVHGYDPGHEEPVNLRITKTGILVDSDDREGEKPLNYDTDRYEKMETFVVQMVRQAKELVR